MNNLTMNDTSPMMFDLRNMDAKPLRVTEIFLSIQGESRTVGLPTVFIRLTG